MGDNSLLVDSEKMQGTVSNSYEEVATTTKTLYANITKIIDNATHNHIWQGQASTKFLEEFEDFKPRFEADLKALERVSEATNGIGGGYRNAEEDIIANNTRSFSDFRKS